MWLILPSIRSYTLVVGAAKRMPLARPVELVRRNAITRLLSTSSTPSSSIRKSGAMSSMSVRKRLMPSIPSYTPPAAAIGVSNLTSSVQQAQ